MTCLSIYSNDFVKNHSQTIRPQTLIFLSLMEELNEGCYFNLSVSEIQQQVTHFLIAVSEEWHVIMTISSFCKTLRTGVFYGSIFEYCLIFFLSAFIFLCFYLSLLLSFFAFIFLFFSVITFF